MYICVYDSMCTCGYDPNSEYYISPLEILSVSTIRLTILEKYSSMLNVWLQVRGNLGTDSKFWYTCQMKH